jgi:DNA-binding transcriptional LysR family regulator
VVATPAGRALYTRARAAQTELRKAEEEIAQLGGDKAGSVAFGVGPVAALVVVPEAVIRFNNQYPAATARIAEGYPSALLPMVRDETLDFAMGPRFATKLDPALAFRPLFREDFIVAGRKGHPLRGAGSLARLAAAMWVGELGGADTPGAPFNRAFLAADLPLPRQLIRCETYNIAASLLAKSDMLGIIARNYLSTAPACDLIQEIPVTDVMPSLTIGLFMRKDPPLTPTAAAMAKIITAVTRQFTVRP